MRHRGLLLLLLLAVLALGAAGCGGGEDTTATPETVVGTLPDDSGGGGGGNEADELEGDAAAGEAVFASNGCGSCHVLAAANASGTVGPNLDETQPSTEVVIDRVTNGRGAMPAFGDRLEAQQIADVAAYITENAG